MSLGMNSQNNYYFGQQSSNMDVMDQGTWQQPLLNSSGSFNNQSSSLNAAFSTGISNFSNSIGMGQSGMQSSYGNRGQEYNDYDYTTGIDLFGNMLGKSAFRDWDNENRMYDESVNMNGNMRMRNRRNARFNPGYNRADNNWNNSMRNRRPGFNCADNYGFNDSSRRQYHEPLYDDTETYQSADSYYDDVPNNMTISLIPANFNKWRFLRKYFEKSDDNLVEHLYAVHEKSCQECKEKHEERKAKKKKKGNNDASETKEGEENAAEEEITEEELQMRAIMGFTGFSTTKGSKVKTNYPNSGDDIPESVSSSNLSEYTTQDSTTLTTEERKMISSLGGYSVFSKNDQSDDVAFGAPAVTMDTNASQDESQEN